MVLREREVLEDEWRLKRMDLLQVLINGRDLYVHFDIIKDIHAVLLTELFQLEFKVALTVFIREHL